LELYKSEVEKFQEYLVKKYGTSDGDQRLLFQTEDSVRVVCTHLSRDREIIQECHDIIEKVETSKRVHEDAHTLLLKCKSSADKTIKKLAQFMMTETLDNRRYNQVASTLTDPDSAIFWVQNFGWLKSEVPIDLFAAQYRKYCMEIHGWDEKSAVPEPILDKMLTSVLFGKQFSSFPFSM
jgi:hypothetical protein